MNFSSVNHPSIQERVLFVCLGNICRSPIAQGILESKGGYLQVDSAATSDYHLGSPPDPRSIEICSQNGIDISHQRARLVKEQDMYSFDYVVAMDATVFNFLKQSVEGDLALLKKIQMMSPKGDDIPDPYYGEEDGFKQVYQLLSSAIQTTLLS